MIEINDVAGLDKLFKFENIYIASQPNSETFEWIGKQNISHIINLRDIDEMDFSFELKECENRNLKYDQFPITSNGEFITKNLEKINHLVNDKSKTFFIHCGTATRVMAWLLTYLPVHRNMSFDQSQQIVTEMGFANPKLLDQAKKLLIV